MLIKNKMKVIYGKNTGIGQKTKEKQLKKGTKTRYIHRAQQLVHLGIM